MTAELHPLFEAFREDHALLGKGFYELSTCLRAKDVRCARQAAERLNEEAGAHIAFEEETFYPTLARRQSYDAERLYEEHSEGLTVVRAVLDMDESEEMTDAKQRALLADSESMEEHIAECGELFEAMRTMPDDELRHLYDALVAWREKKPTWLEYDRSRRKVPVC